LPDFLLRFYFHRAGHQGVLYQNELWGNEKEEREGSGQTEKNKRGGGAGADFFPTDSSNQNIRTINAERGK